MKKLKEQLQALLLENPQKNWNVKEIAKKLHVKGYHRKELKKLLKSLSKEHSLKKVKKNTYAVSGESRSESGRGGLDVAQGRFSMHYDGYGFVIFDDRERPDVFVAFRNKGGALPDDRVEVEIHPGRRGDKTEGYITAVLERGREEWIGTLQKIGREYYVINREFHDEYPIFVPGELISEAQEGDVVVCRITKFPEGPREVMEGEITHVLGPEGEESTEIQTVLAKHHIPQKFPQSVIKEAKSLKPYKALDLDERVDLRDKPFITIDGADARDFDDAIYVERTRAGYRLFVSIADVSHYVRPRSELDEEAFKRGNSTYFPRFAIPMLPEELSNDLCSLKEGVDRPTMTCEIIYDLQGRCEHASYYKSVIHSRKRGIYEDLQRLFDGERVKGYESLPDLKPAVDLANLLMKDRKQRGALDFDLPEPYFQYNEDKQLIAVRKRERLFAHQLIEEFMIAANEALARLFDHHGVPSLYRVHESPDPQKMASLRTLMNNLGINAFLPDNPPPKALSAVLAKVKGHPSEEAINQALLRSLRVAVYSEGNKGHFGLNLSHYCHFTSPIRRYPDLVVHRCLSYMLKAAQAKTLDLSMADFFGRKKGSTGAKKGPYPVAVLHRMGQQTSDTERQSMEAEREMQDLLKTIFMKSRVGEIYEGVVRRVVKFGLFIELRPHCIEGLLRIGDLGLDRAHFDETHARITGKDGEGLKTFKLGSTVSVQVIHADVPRRQIELGLAHLQKRSPSPHRKSTKAEAAAQQSGRKPKREFSGSRRSTKKSRRKPGRSRGPRR